MVGEVYLQLLQVAEPGYDFPQGVPRPPINVSHVDNESQRGEGR